MHLGLEADRLVAAERPTISPKSPPSRAGARRALVAKLWGLQSVQLISSAYAVDDANRNVDSDAQRTRLWSWSHRCASSRPA
jgi:hypothetical protein